MASEEVSKFNVNFRNFLKDVDIIAKSQGKSEGFQLIINLINAGDLMTDPATKIVWFSKILNNEYEISESSKKKATLRVIYEMENYSRFINIMMEEIKAIVGSNNLEFKFNKLDEDDQELIQAYIQSFIKITDNYLN